MVFTIIRTCSNVSHSGLASGPQIRKRRRNLVILRFKIWPAIFGIRLYSLSKPNNIFFHGTHLTILIRYASQRVLTLG